MTAEMILFGMLAIVAVLAGIGVVAARAVLHSALFLALNFVCLATLYVTLSAEFLAAVQALVYAGAVIVLFLFAVSLLPAQSRPLRPGLIPRAAFALGLAVALLAEVVAAVLFLAGNGAELPAAASRRGASATGAVGSPEAIGELLFTEFLFPFEVVSVLLLAAIVGAMVLARRKP